MMPDTKESFPIRNPGSHEGDLTSPQDSATVVTRSTDNASIERDRNAEATIVPETVIANAMSNWGDIRKNLPA